MSASDKGAEDVAAGHHRPGLAAGDTNHRVTKPITMGSAQPEVGLSALAMLSTTSGRITPLPPSD